MRVSLRNIKHLLIVAAVIFSSSLGGFLDIAASIQAQGARQLPTRIEAHDTPADITINGDLSTVLATGDYNGDGVDDFFAVYYARQPSIAFQKYGITFGKRGQSLPVKIDLLKDEPDLSLTTERGGFNSLTITKFGDLNDDGIDDIALSQFLSGEGGTPGSSVIKIFFGSSSLQPGVVNLDALQPGLTVIPDRRAAVTGAAGVADMNGDGTSDLVLTERGGPNITYVIATLLGPFPAGETRDLNSQKADAIVAFSGVETVDSVLLGDVNGDGTADLLVRKSKIDNSNIGLSLVTLNVIFGSEDLSSGAEITLSDGQGDAIIATGNYYFTTIITAGDINGDGFDDILIGTPLFFGEAPPPPVFFGRVSIILGSTSIAGVVSQPDVLITNLSIPSLLESESVVSFGDSLGQSLDVSDIDGDGISDILIGAPGAYIKDGRVKFFSRAHVILGSTEIKKGAPVAIGENQQDVTISFDSKTGDVGRQIGSGDFNGDGIRDILVSNFSTDYVFFGGSLRAPEITKAKYRKSSSELLVFGADLTGAARVEINGVVIDREGTFEPDEGRLVVHGRKSELNLLDGKNQIVVVRKGARSNTIKLKL